MLFVKHRDFLLGLEKGDYNNFYLSCKSVKSDQSKEWYPIIYNNNNII